MPPTVCRAAGVVVAVSLLSLTSAERAEAYIGPGAGFAVLGSFLVFAAALLAALFVLLTWPARALIRRRRQRRAYARSLIDRVVVLGLDGMDPKIAESMMAAGRLPHLARLRDTGTYASLATTCPAMSPVAWSSFSTGTGPGRHGIFDFLHRDPRTYLPALSSVRIRPPSRTLKLGRWSIPLARPELRLLRRSRAFWSVLGEHGIFSTILRVPITFPPEPFDGLLLSGMCVPDLRGTQGSFTLFTTSDAEAGEHIGGTRLRLTRDNGVFRGTLPGPPMSGSGDGRSASVPFRLRPEGDAAARLQIDGQRVLLHRGDHSDWIPVSFQTGPGMRARGIVRCCLKQIEPDVELYVSPINIDPERPALPVSHPRIYSTYLAKRLGPYATLGLAEDTWALNEGVLDEAAFLEQCRLLFAERERMLDNALRNARKGCVVCVFDTTDRVQHMFWRYRENDHPAHESGDDQAFSGTIERVYEQADALVGKVTSQLRERDALIVLSDHGFSSFRRGVNINAWLRDQGYLALREGATGEADWLRDVDWGRTRAYALGLGGIYLNLEGREEKGAVPRGAAPALKQELIEELTGLRDEETGQIAVERVFDTAVVNPGPYVEAGPDLTVGYAPGYRASWDAAQGRCSGPIVEDNTRRWSGDHCLDPRHVPGVLFSSRPLDTSGARIMDIAPTLLDFFGIETPAYMEGRSLVSAREREQVTS